MGGFASFEEIQVWQKARLLINELYVITGRGAFAKDFGLRDQLRRAGVSTMANIAEGYERGGNREFLQFLSVAKASAGEVRSHLYLALDLHFIDNREFERLAGMSREVSKMLSGLMAYLRRTGMKGRKYLDPA